MRFIALDLDKKTALATSFDKSQAQLQEKRVALDPTNLTAFKDTLLPDDVLCLEACPGSFYVADFLRPAVAEVVLVNPGPFGRLLAMNKQKTDRNDSGLMCRLFMADALPTVWLPDEETREERLYCEHCRSLDHERTRLRNRLHALLTEHGLGTQAEELLKKDISLLLARVAGAFTELGYDALASTLRLLDVVEQELKTARARLVQRVHGRESNELAASIPGVDDFLASIMMSCIGDISRFNTAAGLPNYAGLTPTLHSSGPGKPKHGRITKRGSKGLRWAAVEAAKNAVRTPGHFRNKYLRKRRKGKNHAQAVIAIAGDLLEVLWHILTNREKYRDVTEDFQDRKDLRRSKNHRAAAVTVKASVDPRESVRDNVGVLRDILQSMAA